MAAGTNFPTPPSLVPFFIGAVPIFPKKSATYAEILKTSLSKDTALFVDGQKPSYSDILKVHRNSSSSEQIHSAGIPLSVVELKHITQHQGKPAISFTDSDKKGLIDKLNHVLVAKWSHGRPSMATIRKFFFNLHLKGDFNLAFYDSKHMFVECVLFEDFVNIWLKGVWFIDGFQMRMFKWTEDFHPSIESSIAPVWVHFPELPLYLFDVCSLLSIANAIGRPLKIDPYNINRTKLSCASICVEIDVSKVKIDEIWIKFTKDDSTSVFQEFCQKVFYGFTPPFCHGCEHLGHSVSSCKRVLHSYEDNFNRVQSELEGISSNARLSSSSNARVSAIFEVREVVGHGEGTFGRPESLPRRQEETVEESALNIQCKEQNEATGLLGLHSTYLTDHYSESERAGNAWNAGRARNAGNAMSAGDAGRARVPDAKVPAVGNLGASDAAGQTVAGQILDRVLRREMCLAEVDGDDLGVIADGDGLGTCGSKSTTQQGAAAAANSEEQTKGLKQLECMLATKILNSGQLMLRMEPQLQQGSRSIEDAGQKELEQSEHQTQFTAQTKDGKGQTAAFADGNQVSTGKKPDAASPVEHMANVVGGTDMETTEFANKIANAESCNSVGNYSRITKKQGKDGDVQVFQNSLCAEVTKLKAIGAVEKAASSKLGVFVCTNTNSNEEGKASTEIYEQLPTSKHTQGKTESWADQAEKQDVTDAFTMLKERMNRLKEREHDWKAGVLNYNKGNVIIRAKEVGQPRTPNTMKNLKEYFETSAAKINIAMERKKNSPCGSRFSRLVP